MRNDGGPMAVFDALPAEVRAALAAVARLQAEALHYADGAVRSGAPALLVAAWVARKYGRDATAAGPPRRPRRAALRVFRGGDGGVAAGVPSGDVPASSSHPERGRG